VRPSPPSIENTQRQKRRQRGRSGGSRNMVNIMIVTFCAIAVLAIYELSALLGENTEYTNSKTTYGPENAWSDVKLLIYLTTHLPEAHVAFLPCWKDAIERLSLFKYADGMIYTSRDLSEEQLKLLPFRTTTIKRVPANIGYQAGAVQAIIDPFLDENLTWFDDYDWVIRMNLDALIREDSWLIQTMLNDTVDMIVHDCKKYSNRPLFHTDFIAFRPRAVDRWTLLQSDRVNAENHITKAFRHVYDLKRFAYVEGAKNKKEGFCRISGCKESLIMPEFLYCCCVKC
jgi:hypothetical protein